MTRDLGSKVRILLVVVVVMVVLRLLLKRPSLMRNRFDSEQQSVKDTRLRKRTACEIGWSLFVSLIPFHTLLLLPLLDLPPRNSSTLPTWASKTQT